MLERYWVWEYGLFEKNPKRVDSLNPETTLEVVKYADAQATIADLQEQVERLEREQQSALDLLDLYQDRTTKAEAERDKTIIELTETINSLEKHRNNEIERTRVARAERDGMQQRVAQLEGELRGKRNTNPCDKILDHKWLDHECVEGGCSSLWYRNQIKDLQADHARVLGLVQALPVAVNQMTVENDRYMRYATAGKLNYLVATPSKEYAEAFIALLRYRASLPAQPAQEGA